MIVKYVVVMLGKGVEFVGKQIELGNSVGRSCHNALVTDIV